MRTLYIEERNESSSLYVCVCVFNVGSLQGGDAKWLKNKLRFFSASPLLTASMGKRWEGNRRMNWDRKGKNITNERTVRQQEDIFIRKMWVFFLSY